MKLSIIIPVFNGGEDFRTCLEALQGSTRAPDELIAVCDGTTDGSDRLAESLGARVVRVPGGPRGPAAARNLGMAAAEGNVFVFIDADVRVHPDTIERIETHFDAHPEIDALFGSYDDAPLHRGVVSLYKNLLHHYTHQQSAGPAVTFWAGCGAIRRRVYERVGGFDEGFGRPSIEDIAYGGTMVAAGLRVELVPDIQAAHLKRWTLSSMLRSDIFDRAIPWSRMIAKGKETPVTLNLDWRNRVSAALAWLGLLFGVGGFFVPVLWLGLLGCALGVLLVNIELYRFFAARGGTAFAAGGFFLHGLYFLYSSLVYVWVRILRT